MPTMMPPAIAPVRSRMAGSICINQSLQQVEDREEHHPNDVDEVPVERARGDAEIFLTRVDARGRLEQQHGQIANADEYVKPVHAGQREKRSPENTAAPPAHVLAEDEVVVFVGLAA